MSKRNNVQINIDERERIDLVWNYNKTKQRFEFDNKTYEKDGKWYWITTDKYVRDINKYEEEFIGDYLKKYNEIFI